MYFHASSLSPYRFLASERQGMGLFSADLFSALIAEK
jgi:hypothetical protein